MGVPGRAFWPAILSLLYVGAAAWQQTGNAWVSLLALLGLPAALLLIWRKTTSERERGDRASHTVRQCLRAASWGSMLWLVARLAPAGRPAFDVAANVGVATAAVAACIALARIPAAQSLLKPAPTTRSFDAAAFTALLWSIATAVPLARLVLPGPGVWLDPLAIDFTTTTAAVASLLVLMASAWRARLSRRLELGVADRAAGALALATTAFAIAIPAAAADIAAPDRIVPALVLAGSLAVIGTCSTSQAARVSRVLRATLAVMLLGVPIGLLSAVLIRDNPAHAPTIALVSFGLCVLVGLVARAAADPLGPEHSRWLMALEAASRGALDPEPDRALVGALKGLQKIAADPQTRAEIWCTDPERVLSIDVAGYLHSEAASAPERLYELALDEPERTLRTEVLKALQVRKPEIRPLYAWLETRGVFSATTIADDTGPIGIILLPRGQRKAPLTLEEAEAMAALADRISALLSVSSALSRARERELASQRRVEELTQQRDRLQRTLTGEPARHRAFAELLAEPAKAATYSPAARLTLAELSRLARSSTALAFRAPLGVDVTAWAALAHLESARSEGPFVVVDGSAEPALTREDTANPERSPWFLAEGGTLAILNFDALTQEAQEEIGRRWERSEADTGLFVVLAATPRSKSFAPVIERRILSFQLDLPALRDRGEDLRALIFDQLSRSHTVASGEPLGIEPHALHALLEHDWPGNDLELRDVLTRAAGVAEGSLITLDDLTSIHFTPRERAPVVDDADFAPLQLSPYARRKRTPRRR